MKEHETYYPCMPFGAVEFDGGLQICAFCHYQWPDRDHLDQHNVTLCTNASKGPTRKSRKSLMVQHLAFHGVTDQSIASDLADKWQCKRNKRAFSCGFCVKTFSSIMEQLNHIDNEHFKNGQGKSSWDISTVIKGLLHQPKVEKYWNRLLGSDPSLLESSFRWNTPAAENLQAQLETGDESGGDLALTAFGSSVRAVEKMCANIPTPITVPVLQHLALDPFSVATSSRNTSEQAPVKNTTQKPSSPAGRLAVPYSRFQPGTPSWSQINDSQVALHLPHSDPPLDHAPFHPNSCGSGDHGGHYTSQPTQALAFEDNYSLSDVNPSLYTLPNEHKSFHPESSFDQHARLQGSINGNGDLMTAQLSYIPYESSTSIADPIHAHPTSHPRLMSYETFSTEAKSTSPSLDLGSENRVRRPASLEKPLPALPTDGPPGRNRPMSPASSMDLDNT